MELEELRQALSAYGLNGQGEDDASVGKRGLAALTESTRADDWSLYYPDELRNCDQRT